MLKKQFRKLKFLQQISARSTILSRRSSLQLLSPLLGGRRLHARVGPRQRPLFPGRPLLRTRTPASRPVRTATRSQESPSH